MTILKELIMYQSLFTQQEQAIIAQSAAIIKSKIKTENMFNSPQMVADFCQHSLVTSEREVFAVLLLDSQNRLIECVELFYGTINAASVYPREVVKLVLNHNAASVIFTHNHPSGIAEPSQADKLITTKLSNALNLIDVTVLDHLVVGTDSTVSFAERGLI